MFVQTPMHLFKIKSFHKLIASLVLAIFVFFAVRYAVPKPKTIGFIFMLVLLIDVWIDYWMRTNVRAKHVSPLPQRTSKIFLRIFYATVVAFILMIIGFWIAPLPYWTPVLRVYGYGTIVITIAIKLFLATIFFVQFLISKNRFTNKIASPKRWFQVGVWMVVLMFAATLYGSIYEVFDLRVHRVEVRDKAVPKTFADYKIVQFSDMHIGNQISQRYVKKLVDSINAQNPDLVVFTGDMVNFHTEEIVPFVPLLSQIRATDGIFVVFGNHDYSSYRRWKTPKDSADNVQRLADIYHSMGWNVLSNEHVYLHRGDDSIALAGVENYSSKKNKRWENIADTEKALKGVSPSNFIVMISHNPEHFEEKLQVDYPYVNLTLTGHSHGGQMAIGMGKHQFSLPRFAMTHWRDFHQLGNQYLNVNTGCGFNVLPFRIYMPPSICAVTLKLNCDF
jgi:predicted MPP superfamily phosphohydrolase